MKDGGSIKARAKVGLSTIELESELSDLEALAPDLREAVARVEEELAPYAALEQERRNLKKARKELAAQTASVLRGRSAEVTAPLELVLGELRASLFDLVSKALAGRALSLTSKYRSWIGKYGTTLRDLETTRNQAAARLDGHLQELGYG